MKTISAYTILFHDLQFYEHILSRIYDKVDEIIIVDDPYSYAQETLKEMELLYTEETKPLLFSNMLERYPKIKYFFQIFDNEEEKRIFAYNQCTKDFVLLIDTDEFVDFDETNLNSFLSQNEKTVCGATIYNMCDYNVAFDPPAQKYILFNRSAIQPREHLDYTWLVGCQQNKPKQELMEIHKSFGTIYHQTLNRNKFNNIIKFLFYELLWRKTNNKNDMCLIAGYENEQLKSLNAQQFLEIFIHSSLEKINIPRLEDKKFYKLYDTQVEFLKPYEINKYDFYFRSPMICLQNVPVFFRIDCRQFLHIVLEGVKNVNVKLIYIFETKRKSIKYTFTDLNRITILLDKSEDVIYTIIEILVTKLTEKKMLTFTVQDIQTQ